MPFSSQKSANHPRACIVICIGKRFIRVEIRKDIFYGRRFACQHRGEVGGVLEVCSGVERVRIKIQAQAGIIEDHDKLIICSLPRVDSLWKSPVDNSLD